MNLKNWLLSTVIAVSLVSAIVQGVFYWFGSQEEPQTAYTAQCIIVYIVAVWVFLDSRRYDKINKPYDYGFFVYVFLLPYLPYYLWRTRGPKGLLIFTGFLLLLLLGPMLGIGLYLWRTV